MENSLNDILMLADELKRRAKSNPKEWVVKDLLKEGETTLLVGDSKIGKSTLAKQISVCVAKGEDVIDRPTLQGPVYYLNFEETESQMIEALEAMGWSEGISLYVLRPESLRQNLFQKLKECCIQTKPRLVVIDTLLDLLPIEDVKDYVQVHAAMIRLRELARQSNAHILIIYHSTKAFASDPIKSPSGSQALTAVPDTTLVLRTKSKQPTFRTLSGKGRIGIVEPIFLNFNIKTKTFSTGKPTEKMKGKASNWVLINRMITYFEQQIGTVTKDQLLEGLKARKQSKLQVLDELLERGWVKTTADSGRKGSPKLYYMPEEEKGKHIIVDFSDIADEELEA